MKKALSLFLTLVMVIGMIPMAASVASAEAIVTEPTTNSTVEIDNAEEFIALLGDGKTAENTKYVLKADIDLSTEGTAKDITATPFVLKNSSFDGEGHTIKGFTLASTASSPAPAGSSNWIGLFKADATLGNTIAVKNLKIGTNIEKIVIENKNWGIASGAVIGAVTEGTSLKLINVDAYVDYSTYTATNGGKIAGALVGYNAGAIEIDSCTSNGNVYCMVSDNSFGVGGIIGRVTETATVTTITNTTNNAAITGTTLLGGIVGYVQKSITVENCVNNGDMSGTSNLGGIVGKINGSGVIAVINGCTNNGDMTGNYCGGIVSEFSTVADADITDCINTGNINDVETVNSNYTHNAGIIAKHVGNVSVTRCINSGNVKAVNTAGGIVAQNQGDITLESCINLGAVTATTSTNTWHGAGGIVAYTNSSVTLLNCRNDGAITAKGFAGGAIGSCDQNKTLIFTSFINKGEIKSTSASAGAGIANARLTSGRIEATDFLNTANVTSYSSAGGVIGLSEPSGDNSALVIDIDRLINTGTIKGRWRGCAATGYIKNAKVSIDNSVSTGAVIKSNDNSVSFAFCDNGDNVGNVTGSGNYAVNGNALGEGFSENLDVSFDTILGVINNADNNFAHGHFALNAEGNNIVVSTPEFEGHQVGAVDTETNTYKVRFLATINDVNLFEGSCEYKYLGMQFSNDGGKTWGITGYAEHVYSSVLGNDDGTLITYTAEKLGGKYIYAFNATGIDATVNKSYVVRTFAIDKSGNEIYGAEYAVELPALVAAN